MQRPTTSLASGDMGRAPFIAAVLPLWRSFRLRWTKHGLPVFSTEPLAPHLALGRQGERLASRHLQRQGYKLLYRNFRAGKAGEIDLVCRHGDVLVFVEVKTRSDEIFGRPIAAVDRKKRRRIARGAMAWLRMLAMPNLTFRFDVVEIVIAKPPEIRVIENAFTLPSNYYY